LSSQRPPIAITMGDPAGIGPEIVAKALRHPELQEFPRPVIVGEASILQRAAEISGIELKLRTVTSVGEPSSDPAVTDVVDVPRNQFGSIDRSRVSVQAGRAAHGYLETAASLALDHRVAGIVTAPLNKEALAAAGWIGVGHTELLASFCSVSPDAVAMMLASDRLRVVHLSTHVSLKRAVELVETGRIVRIGRLAGRSTQEIVGRRPKIAVAGLNPHAGEHGLFGIEDDAQIRPAVEMLRSDGWNVTGPVPPDTVFLRAIEGEFDVVIAMYHDQGHIPSKIAGLSETVNVTLGLPIIRTSVDHGTAFDIAGTGTADESNLIAAYRVATRMVSSRTHMAAT